MRVGVRDPSRKANYLYKTVPNKKTYDRGQLVYQFHWNTLTNPHDGC